jgi:GntR family transcriptional regulator
VNLIDYQDPRPIYEQITEQYKLLVLKGVLSPGEQMPSVRKLAMELAANPNTVQRAYAELERQGIIYTVKGKGSFVSGNISLKEQKKRELRERLQRIVREAGEIGIGLDELMEDLGKDTEAAGASAGAEAADTSEGGG